MVDDDNNASSLANSSAMNDASSSIIINDVSSSQSADNASSTQSADNASSSQSANNCNATINDAIYINEAVLNFTELNDKVSGSQQNFMQIL